jgi:broad specificity phosphatase PhoE
MYNYIFKIVKENEGKTILISSHGVAIEAFLRKIENIKFKYERKKFCQHNVAINELEYENNKFKIIRLADIDYLKNKF